MALYQKLGSINSKYVSKHKLLKYGFNLSPMYRRTTARVTDISKDLLTIKVTLPISYKNKNYVGSIFGGSMFSAVDPFPMVQLINLLDDNYVVWDKSAEILFKAPARQDLYAEFSYSLEELKQIKQQVKKDNEIELVKKTLLTNKDKTKVFCEVRKIIYIADKAHYKAKMKSRASNNQ